MANTPVDLGTGQLGTSATTMVTSASATNTILRRITFYNTHTTVVEVKVYRVRTGSTLGDAGTWIATKSIQVGKTWVCFEAEGHVLAADASLQATASVASAVDYNVSGTASS